MLDFQQTELMFLILEQKFYKVTSGARKKKRTDKYLKKGKGNRTRIVNNYYDSKTHSVYLVYLVHLLDLHSTIIS